MKLAQHGTDQWWHLIRGIQCLFSLFIDTSCPNSSLASERSHEGASAAAQCGAFLAGARASQWSHHRIWDQVLRESKYREQEMYHARCVSPVVLLHCRLKLVILPTLWRYFRILRLVSFDHSLLETMIQYYNFCVLNFCYTNENIPLVIYLLIQILKS